MGSMADETLTLNYYSCDPAASTVRVGDYCGLHTQTGWANSPSLATSGPTLQQKVVVGVSEDLIRWLR